MQPGITVINFGIPAIRAVRMTSMKPLSMRIHSLNSNRLRIKPTMSARS